MNRSRLLLIGFVALALGAFVAFVVYKQIQAKTGGSNEPGINVVVAADDPYTAGSRHRYREWQLLADQVDLHELADGGHYFLRTRPAQAAQAVLRANGWSASS